MKLFDSLTPRSLSKKWLLIPRSILAAGSAGLNTTWQRLMRRSQPQLGGRMTIPGLQHPVEIIRDRWGVPHIFAQNEPDLFFAQGFVQAQDRLFQMDLNRRVGSGRLSELLGPLAINSDRIARSLGWPRVIRAQIDGGDEEARAMADSFVTGINAFIDQGRWPLEYKLLASKPAPWQVDDCAAWGTVLAWGLAANWESELLRAMLVDELGAKKAADLTLSTLPDDPTILPEKQITAHLAHIIMLTYRKFMSTLPLGRLPDGPGIGSNNWVVSGDYTETGRPFLANDPHLPPIFPAIWYENHLVGGRYNVTGFSTPGVPGVVIGHNEHVAWGITNAFPDVQDIYVETFHADDESLVEVDGTWQQLEVVREEIHVRGRRQPIVEEVRYTRHGPIISDLLAGETRPLALQWTAYTKNNHLRAILDINRATDWHSFRDGLRAWGFPCQNIVYADVANNIGYIMPGKVPQRKNGDGMTPVPGWTGEYEWSGWIPFDDLPAQLNPPAGMIATANNRVAGDQYPYLLTNEWLAPYRAGRITSLLEQTKPVSLADNMRIQQDTISPVAERFLRVALPLLSRTRIDMPDAVVALYYLTEWDGDMRADDIAPTLYYGWHFHFLQAALDQAVGPQLRQRLLGPEPIKNFTGNPFHKGSFELAIRWLASGAPDWVGDVQPLLLPAFLKTIDVLRAEYGRHMANWQWGCVRHLNIHHPLSLIPGIGRLWKPVSLPASGDGYTINQMENPPSFPPKSVQMIPSCRMILDVGAWDNCLSALPGGQSGHINSPHYQDGIAEWHDGRYHPMLFSRDKIEAAAEAMLCLEVVS